MEDRPLVCFFAAPGENSHPYQMLGFNAGLLDPSGSLSAEDLQFSWKAGTKGGTGKNVHLELAGVMMDAEKAESIPGAKP